MSNAPADRHRPALLKQGDEYYFNAAAILRWIAELDLTEIKPGSRARIRRFQERVQAAIVAEAMRAAPRDIDALLWATFDGPELNRKLGAMGTKAVDWLLDEQPGAAS